jgi:predicted nucleic acid-binding protein
VLAVLLGEASRGALIRATEGATLVGAPSLPWDVANALTAAVRRRRLTPSQLRTAWTSYTRIPVRLADIDVPRALDVAVSRHLAACDACVLEAARGEGAPLVALDPSLLRAAHAAGVQVLELPR